MDRTGRNSGSLSLVSVNGISSTLHLPSSGFCLIGFQFLHGGGGFTCGKSSCQCHGSGPDDGSTRRHHLSSNYARSFLWSHMSRLIGLAIVTASTQGTTTTPNHGFW